MEEGDEGVERRVGFYVKHAAVELMGISIGVVVEFYGGHLSVLVAWKRLTTPYTFVSRWRCRDHDVEVLDPVFLLELVDGVGSASCGAAASILTTMRRLPFALGRSWTPREEGVVGSRLPAMMV